MTVPCNCCPLDGCFTIGGDTAQPAFGFRCGAATNWYDAAGNPVAAASVQPCPLPPGAVPVPSAVPDLHLLGGAFNDDASGQGENLCNIAPAPSATSGWAAPAAGCYDPTFSQPTMDWTSTTSVDITYGGPSRVSGGVFIHFSSPSLGAISWPAGAAMTVGQQRWSNFFGGGRRARMTYLGGAGAVGNDAPVMPGGTQINLGFGPGGQHIMNVRFLLEFFTP